MFFLFTIFLLENMQPTLLAHPFYSLAYFQEAQNKNACLSVVMLMNITSAGTGDRTALSVSHQKSVF